MTTDQQWANLEERRKQFLAKIESLPADKQLAKPRPGEMSPYDVYEHLALSEEVALNRMKSRQGLGSGDKAKPNFIFGMALKRLNSGVRMPAYKSLVPDVKDAKAAQQHYEQVRAGLREFICAGSEGTALLTYPPVGKLDAGQIMQVFEAHMTYHEKRFPGAP